jgi:hypothetical protein
MFKFLSKLIKGSETGDESVSRKSVEHLAKDNKDIVNSFQLTVTMLPRVPLKLLRRHGEIQKSIPKDDANLSSGDAIWLPVLDEKFKVLSEGGTMWSPAGHIPTDGAEVLQYLIAARKIIEAPLPQPLNEISEALLRLGKIKSLPGGPRYGTDDKYRLVKSEEIQDYFPLFFGDENKALSLLLMALGAPNYNALSFDHILEMHEKGYNSISEILNSPDEVLLALKGVGKKKLGKIRENLPSPSKDESTS